MLTHSTAKLFADQTLVKDQWYLKNLSQTFKAADAKFQSRLLIGKAGEDLGLPDKNTKWATPKRIVKVAVLDTGLDINHPGFKDRLLKNENGEWLAKNFLDDNNNVEDDSGHGTHVASLISLNSQSSLLDHFNDASVKLLPLKIATAKSQQIDGIAFTYKNVEKNISKSFSNVIAEAIHYAIDQEVDLINLSYGIIDLRVTPAIYKAIIRAKEKGILIVAAAGNNRKKLTAFPCKYEEVLCVGSFDPDGELSEFSNFQHVDILAPGHFILGLYPRGMESKVYRMQGYEMKKGTSQAAPLVTGLLAKLLSERPQLRSKELREILFQSSLKNLDSSKELNASKFGKINYQTMLDYVDQKLGTEWVLNPWFKQSTEVSVSARDASFQIELPVENLGKLSAMEDVCLKLAENSSGRVMKINQACFSDLNWDSGEVKKLIFSGAMIDGQADMEQVFELQFLKSRKKFYFSKNFRLSLTNHPQLKTVVVSGVQKSDLIFFDKDQPSLLFSKLRPVIKNKNKDSEYFFIKKSLQSTTKNTISFLRWSENHSKLEVRDLELPKMRNLLGVFAKDIDRDGVDDYVVYALSPDLFLKLYFFDREFRPLFKSLTLQNSQAFKGLKIKLGTFENLFPIEGSREKFQWGEVRIDGRLSLLLPVNLFKFQLREEDNSTSLFKREYQESTHLFFPAFSLMAQNKSEQKTTASDEEGLINFNLQAIDSVSFLNRLNDQLGVDRSFVCRVTRFLPQNKIESDRGLISILVSCDNGKNNTRIFKGSGKPGSDFKFNEVNSQFSNNFSQFLIDPVWGEQDAFVPSDILSHSLLIDGNQLAILDRTLNSNDSKELVQNFKTKFGNPILSHIFAAQFGSGTFHLLEADKSFIWYNSSTKSAQEVPLIRDSSMLSIQLNDAYFPVKLGRSYGLMSKTSMLFLGSAFVLEASAKGLSRPYQKAIEIPEGCAMLDPIFFENQNSSNYGFICGSSEGEKSEVSLKLLPMSSP